MKILLLVVVAFVFILGALEAHGERVTLEEYRQQPSNANLGRKANVGANDQKDSLTTGNKGVAKSGHESKTSTQGNRVGVSEANGETVTLVNRRLLSDANLGRKDNVGANAQKAVEFNGEGGVDRSVSRAEAKDERPRVEAALGIERCAGRKEREWMMAAADSSLDSVRRDRGMCSAVSCSKAVSSMQAPFADHLRQGCYAEERSKGSVRREAVSNQMDSGAWDGSAAADDHESLSSTNDAELLKRAWRTEKAAPEILQFEAVEYHVTKRKKQPNVALSSREAEYAAATMSTQECIMEQPIISQHGVVSDWNNPQARHNEGNVEDFVARGSDPLIVSLNQMDMDRTLYLLRSYLRTRLQKIEKYMFHIHKNTELWNRLSEQEQKFAQRCIEDLEDHFDKSVLSKLPDRYKSSVKQSIISEEDDMGNAFILRKLIGVEDPVDLDPGDLYAVRYKSIKPLVYSGQIELPWVSPPPLTIVQFLKTALPSSSKDDVENNPSAIDIATTDDSGHII
ncbi:hypothetical protein RHSIM_Rhsim04G0240300 [Rhododendron simsii]|uniref:DNA replication complex GINS protein SLD5 n=1 Tax=Rhododendron simsii TaxID=118357 RepID=A0A834LS48_RHOSS|nr:hypothetical protein RHSIM_Rhsim04G0240300 [Rhododendron simsii]